MGGKRVALDFLTTDDTTNTDQRNPIFAGDFQNSLLLLMMGRLLDAGSSVGASLRRKMVRGEGFEPPTNSV